MAFNLFDFSSKLNPLGSIQPQAPQPQVAGATGGGMMPPTTSARPLPQTPITNKPSPSFMEKAITTLVPKASASEGIDNDKYTSFIKDAKARGKTKEETMAKVDELMSKGYFNKTSLAIPTTNISTNVAPVDKPSFLSLLGTNILEGAKGGIERIGEAGVGLAEGKYNVGEAAMRGGAGALETAISPLTGTISTGIQKGVEQLSPETKTSISEFASPKIEAAKQWYDSQSDEQKRNLDNIGVGVELLSNFIGGKAVSKGIKEGGKITSKVPSLEKIANTLNTSDRAINVDIDSGIVKQIRGAAIKANEDLTKSNELIWKALKPSSRQTKTAGAMEGFENNARSAIQSIAKTQGNPSDATDALRKAGLRKKEIFETIQDNNALVTKQTPSSIIVGKIDEAMNSDDFKLLKKTNPGIVKKLEEYKQSFSDGSFSQDELQTLKQNMNKKIPATAWAEMLTMDKDAVLADATVAKIFGDVIDDNVMSVLGTTNKALNKEYGSVRQFEELLAKQVGASKKGVKNGLLGMTDVFTIPNIAIGALTGNVPRIATGAGEFLLSHLRAGESDVNKIIKDLFKLHGKKEGIIQKLLNLPNKNESFKIDNPKPAPEKPLLLMPGKIKARQMPSMERIEKSRPKRPQGEIKTKNPIMTIDEAKKQAIKNAEKAARIKKAKDIIINLSK